MQRGRETREDSNADIYAIIRFQRRLLVLLKFLWEGLTIDGNWQLTNRILVRHAYPRSRSWPLQLFLAIRKFGIMPVFMWPQCGQVQNSNYEP
jgi:hypothetical protein